MSKCFLYFFLTFILISQPLHAELSRVITLDQIGKIIRKQNPDLAAARLQIQEAEGRLLQAGRLKNPELEITLEPNTAFREGKLEAGISQKFPLTKRLTHEKNLSRFLLAAAKAEVLAEEFKLLSEGQALMIEALALQQQRKLLLERAATGKGFLELFKKLNQTGEASSLDIVEAKLEAAALATEIRFAESEEIRAIGKLKILLGMNPQQAVQLSYDFTNLALPPVSAPLENRAEVAAAKLFAKAAAERVKLQKAQSYDDLEAGIFTAIEREENASKSLENESILGLQLKWPWPFWNKKEGAILEAQAKQQRKEQEVHALENRLQLEVETARSEMLEWKKTVQEMDQVLSSFATEQTSLTQDAFQKGEADMQSLLRSREKMGKFQMNRLHALREFHLARIRYQTSLGNL